jgi:hypothetical protein
MWDKPDDFLDHQRRGLCMVVKGLRGMLTRQLGRFTGHFAARGTAAVLRICYGNSGRLLHWRKPRPPGVGVHETLRVHLDVCHRAARLAFRGRLTTRGSDARAYGFLAAKPSLHLGRNPRSGLVIAVASRSLTCQIASPARQRRRGSFLDGRPFDWPIHVPKSEDQQASPAPLGRPAHGQPMRRRQSRM